MHLSGKTVLVTGASSGIGRATALDAARRGATVILVARTQAKLEEVADGIRAAGGTAHVHPIDLSDGHAVVAGAQAITHAHGTPDVIINNAGAGAWKAVEETGIDEIVSMMGAPYFAAFFVTRAFLPDMIHRGSGHLVTVNSPACLMSFPGAAGYSATRTALRAWHEALSQELRGTGLGTTHLIAGEVSSAYFDHNPDSHERLPAIARVYRVLPPEEVATRMLDGVQRGRKQVVIPFLMWLTWLAYELMPWLVRPIVWATAWRRPS